MSILFDRRVRWLSPGMSFGLRLSSMAFLQVSRFMRRSHAKPRARGLPASPDRAPMSFPQGAGLYAGDRLTGGWHHAETDLRHERDPGRLHRRARRRHRLERAAERRAVPVVAGPGAGERPVAVRAQAMGDDELLLADRR